MPRTPLAVRAAVRVLLHAWPVTVPLAVWAISEATSALAAALIISTGLLIATDVRDGRYATANRQAFNPAGTRYREQVINQWASVLTSVGLTPTALPHPEWWQGLMPLTEKLRRLAGYLSDAIDDYPPTLRALTVVSVGHRATVRMCPGQTVRDYRGAADALAAMWRALDVRVLPGEPGHVLLDIVTRDPLAVAMSPTGHARGATTGPAPRTTPPVDLHAVPVGVTEDGRPWTLTVLDQPGILISGVPGSGKSALLTTLVRALGGHPHVRIDGIDMKRGVDLTPARRAGLITTLATDAAEARALLVELYREHIWRLDELSERGINKVSELGVSEEFPLRVLLIDEAADVFTPLTSAREDKEVTAEITKLVSILVRQGRATGITVVLATQKPTADAIPTQIRDAATSRVALRCATAEQARAALGDAYDAAPASPATISAATPGVAIAAHTSGTRSQPGGDVRRVRVYEASAIKHPSGRVPVARTGDVLADARTAAPTDGHGEGSA